MLQSAVEAPSQDLLTRLRRETAQAHARLERELDLLRAPASRRRFARLLGRFHGFHLVWEPVVARALRDDTFFAPRHRGDLLRTDLRALGLDEREIAALPACEAAAGLATTRAAAIGSLYVLEGSTLGGQVIGRALAGAPWLPPGGLRYFDPYGRETGTLWRQFRSWAEAAAPPDAAPEIVAAARATFDLLHDWLIPLRAVEP
jgi:heme oxygenase